MKRPSFVSIITPTHNSASSVVDTIKTVQDQTHPEWEMILVDDGSEDMTTEIVETLARNDSRIRLMRLSQSSGYPMARNVALGAAAGTHIAFLNSGDLWLPQKLEHQLTFMAVNECPISYTQCRYISSSGRRQSAVYNVRRKVTYEDLLTGPVIESLSTVMISRDQVGSILFPIHYLADHAYLLNLLKEDRNMMGLSTELARIRFTPRHRFMHKWDYIKQAHDLFTEEEKLSKLQNWLAWLRFSWTIYNEDPPQLAMVKKTS